MGSRPTSEQIRNVGAWASQSLRSVQKKIIAQALIRYREGIRRGYQPEPVPTNSQPRDRKALTRNQPTKPREKQYA
jgi:hypothetical protein